VTRQSVTTIDIPDDSPTNGQADRPNRGQNNIHSKFDRKIGIR